MNDVSQLATGMVALTFTAALWLSGQWFVNYRVQHEAQAPRQLSMTIVATLPP